MNKIIVALGLLISSSVFAYPGQKTPNGNKGRAAVLAAVGVKAGTKARVVALQTVSRHDKEVPTPALGRISVVQHTVGKNVQISYVKLAADGTAKALSDRQVNKLGLLTGPQAIAQVKKENGRIDGKVSGPLSVTGLSKYGSSIVVLENVKAKNPSYDNVRRYVTLTGTGRSSDSAE
jgi:hypothetical protein